MPNSDWSYRNPTYLAVDERAPGPLETRTATFGLGCFWGPDARFGAMDGVVRTRVGYAGGSDPNPSYYALGDHTEVVQVEYDPGALTYEDLLDVVWESHNWATNARKRQYRGVVLTHDGDQHRAVDSAVEALAAETGRSVETDVEPLDTFHLAEQYHQKYELRSTPIVGDELLESCGDAFIDSTAATRLNGFVAGHGTAELRRDLLAALDLSPMALDEVHRRVV